MKYVKSSTTIGTYSLIYQEVIVMQKFRNPQPSHQKVLVAKSFSGPVSLPPHSAPRQG